jgi:hypothetical protein
MLSQPLLTHQYFLEMLKSLDSHPLGGKKTLQCPWASKKTKKTLVLGVDIGLEDSVSMALCNLVGMLSYRYLFTTKLDDWMINTLQPLLGYVPSLSYLGRGWLHF